MSKWNSSSMLSCFLHTQTRIIDMMANRPKDTPFDYDCIMFSDGTGVAVRLDEGYAYSELTVEGPSLFWYIYSPSKEPSDAD